MIAEALSYPFFQRALVAGLLASIACGIIGTFVVVKRIASISGGVSHAALGGVGLGYFFGFSPMLGAMLVAVLAAVLIGRAHLRQHQSLDTLIAVTWSLGMALGVLLIAFTPGYVPDLNGYLFGSIVYVPLDYLLLVLTLDLVIAGTVFFFFSYFQAIAFDEEFAKVRGVPLESMFLLLLVLTSLAIVILMKVVGVIMLIALLTIPAIIGRQWSDNLLGMMCLASILSMFCTTVGLFLSYWLPLRFSLNAPSGVLIILLTIACFGCSCLLRRFVV